MWSFHVQAVTAERRGSVQSYRNTRTASHTTAATPSLLQSWASRRSRSTKRNCAEELWSFESAGSEFSTYGTRAMLQTNRKHNMQQFLTGRGAHARSLTSSLDLQSTLTIGYCHLLADSHAAQKTRGVPFENPNAKFTVKRVRQALTFIQWMKPRTSRSTSARWHPKTSCLGNAERDR